MAQTQKQLDNLKKGAKYRFTKENAAEMGRRGQKASVEGHKRKKSLAEYATIVQNADVTEESDREELRKIGIEDEIQQQAALIVKAVFRAAAGGSIPAVDKWEEFLEKAAAEYGMPAPSPRIPAAPWRWSTPTTSRTSPPTSAPSPSPHSSTASRIMRRSAVAEVSNLPGLR